MSLKLHLVSDAPGDHHGRSEHSSLTIASVAAPSLAGPALRLVPSTTPADERVAPQGTHQPRPTGVAFVPLANPSGGHIYICDPDAHVINVLDQNCRPCFSFGGPGTGLGQLDTPTDVTVVRLAKTNLADPADSSVDAELLVVADRGNHRIQLFELDGAVIGEIGGHAGAWTTGRFPAPAGSPFFRIGDVPPLPFPSRLEWRTPHLDVACAATVIRIDLAEMLLPEFNVWIAEASRAELRLAFLRFAKDPNRADIPESCLSEIAERLQPAWRREASLHPHATR
jgi:hypothetical protein